LRIHARELLRQPGTQREIETDLAPSDLGIADDRITGDIGVDLVAISNIDGIVVHGTIATPWHAPCRRCLTDVHGVSRIDVDEVYQDDVTDADAYEIEGDQIDLAPAVREYVMIELPDGPLCRDDCAGICPLCGADRNESSCDCDTTVKDERWAVLDALKLDDEEL
jgi:uncharacterized protein